MKTIKAVQDHLRPHGIVVSKKNETGEFKVNHRGGHESTAYYTDHLEDALHTGLAMASKSRHSPGGKKVK